MWFPLFDIAFFMYGLVALLGFAGYLYKCSKSGKKARNVEFVIPSVADEKTEKSLKEVIKKIREKFQGYKIWIVVDEGKEINIDGAETVVVPSWFEGRPCKGRALEYFVRFYAKPDKWYCFLDDDSYPMDDSFLYEIPHYEKLGYAAANGILVPRNSRSKLCYVLDHLRLWDDLFVFRFNTGLLKRPYIGLHGELLIIKGSVLKEIGFPTDSITEDFVLAQKLVKKGYKTWQSRTRVSIKSPNSIKDFWKQRARWIRGIAESMKHCSPASTAFIFFRMVGGFLSSILFAPFWLLMPPSTPIAWLGLVGTIYYVSSYFYGALKSGDWKMLLLLPVMPIFEPASLIYVPKTNGFVVIDKN